MLLRKGEFLRLFWVRRVEKFFSEALVDRLADFFLGSGVFRWFEDFTRESPMYCRLTGFDFMWKGL